MNDIAMKPYDLMVSYLVVFISVFAPALCSSNRTGKNCMLWSAYSFLPVLYWSMVIICLSVVHCPSGSLMFPFTRDLFQCILAP